MIKSTCAVSVAEPPFAVMLYLSSLLSVRRRSRAAPLDSVSPGDCIQVSEGRQGMRERGEEAKAVCQTGDLKRERDRNEIPSGNGMKEGRSHSFGSDGQ